MFIKTILLSYLTLVIYGLIQKIQFFPPKEEAKPKPLEDIFQHPYLVSAGIQRPLEEVPLEEVEETPLCWQIRYNEKQTDFITIIEIEQ